MSYKVRPKLFGGFLVILSCGMIFALGEMPNIMEQLVNYPNPFDSRKEETFISYRLAQDFPVRVKIYDLFGYPVKEFNFSAGEMGAKAGVNQIKWDGSDGTGEKVSKGGYICQVIVDGELPVKGIRKIGVIH